MSVKVHIARGRTESVPARSVCTCRRTDRTSATCNRSSQGTFRTSRRYRGTRRRTAGTSLERPNTGGDAAGPPRRTRRTLRRVAKPPLRNLGSTIAAGPIRPPRSSRRRVRWCSRRCGIRPPRSRIPPCCAVRRTSRCLRCRRVRHRRGLPHRTPHPSPRGSGRLPATRIAGCLRNPVRSGTRYPGRPWAGTALRPSTAKVPTNPI